MKKSIKKKLIILCAVSAVLIGSTASVLASPTVRPMPGSSQSNTVTSSGTSAEDETSSGTGNYRASNNNSSNSGVTRDVPTAIPVTDNGQVNIVTDTEKAAGEKKSVSIGGMIGWLLLSIIINAAISFWIGNRFYRLSKKDSHVTAEIRALRRDVEEKFLQSVGGFAEQETDIANSNDDYSMNEEGITMQRRQRAEKPASAEEDEMFKKWESRMNTSHKTARQTSSHSQSSSYESNRRRKYQPTREELEPEDYEDVDMETDDDDDSRSGLKSKAKEILGDIFPFKED